MDQENYLDLQTIGHTDAQHLLVICLWVGSLPITTALIARTLSEL